MQPARRLSVVGRAGRRTRRACSRSARARGKLLDEIDGLLLTGGGDVDPGALRRGAAPDRRRCRAGTRRVRDRSGAARDGWRPAAARHLPRRAGAERRRRRHARPGHPVARSTSTLSHSIVEPKSADAHAVQRRAGIAARTGARQSRRRRAHLPRQQPASSVGRPRRLGSRRARPPRPTASSKRSKSAGLRRSASASSGTRRTSGAPANSRRCSSVRRRRARPPVASDFSRDRVVASRLTSRNFAACSSVKPLRALHQH